MQNRIPGCTHPIVPQSRLLDGLFALSGSLPRGKAALPRLAGRLLLGKRQYRVKMPAGFAMLWRASVIDMLVYFWRTGDWDDLVLKVLKEEARPGAVVYDIGANAGYMSLSLAHHEPQARVFAFEPLPDLAATLVSSAQLNGFDNLSVLQLALTDRTGPVELHLPAHAIHASLQPRGRSIRLDVQGRTLDSLVADGSIPPPDAIKIDVEGAELLLFKGAGNVLSTHRPALIFECDENSLRFGHSPATVFAFLQQFGYDRFERLEEGRPPTILSGSELIDPGFGNFRVRADRTEG